jgi:hypothetical protein
VSGDYTRVRFDPADDYSGVLLQQGRVTLDADVNEQVDLLDRRLRADIVDTLARGAISRETPAAFLLAFAGADLTIAPGRALVHGLLAENHGAAPVEYDPVLGEQRGTAPISYLDQPYLPDAATLAPLPAGGTHLAYLDVWQREVDCLVDPGLVEQAVAVDTTTRRQTAWQVRFAKAADGDTCASENAEYDAATAPSDGRLSTAAVGVPASTDPCTIAPFGGYRGLENRLYRVEIHDPGPLGTATFKWSRDNASLGASVLGIDAGRTTLTLSRLGRDGVKRIAVGDWIEVTDDHHELHRLPGELRQVSAVDEVRAEVTLAAALGTGAFDATDAQRHTRVIRWDQAGPAVDAAGGTVAVPAGAAAPVPLEDGIEVAFDVAAAGGTFHLGDHWEFAARTADASVEQLAGEPPRGVLHHHMKLGIVTFPGTVVDCRPAPPEVEAGGCECDVCVTPESHASGALTIQAAVDRLRGKGGKVCLQVGVYRLEQPVLIDRATSLHLQGKGWKTIVLAGRAGPAFVVERSIGVTIDLLTVIAPAVARRGQTALGTAIALSTTVGTIVERCVLLQLALLERGPERLPGPGRPEEGERPEDPCPPEGLKRFVGKTRLITDLRAPIGPKGTGGPLIALDGLVLATLIQENVLVGATGIGALGADFGTPVVVNPETGERPPLGNPTHVAPWRPVDGQPRERASYLLTFDLAIEDNLLLCWLTGVSLEGFAVHQGETRIAGNEAFVCLRAGIAATGFVGSGGRLDIARNVVRGLGAGIAFAGDDTRVADNDVKLLTGAASTRKEGSLVALGTALARNSGLLKESVGRVAAYVQLFGGDGIVAVPGLRPSGIDRAQIRGNRVVEVIGDGIALQTRIVSAQIAGNVVQRVGGDGIAMNESAVAEELLIEGNQLFEIGRVRDRENALVGAVVLRNVVDAAVLGNQIRGVGAEAQGALGRVGVLVVGAVTLRVGCNSILEVGAAEFAGVGAGVLAGGLLERVDVHDNTIRRARRATPTEGPGSTWTAIAILVAGTARDGGAGPQAAGDEDDGEGGEAHTVLDRASTTVFVAGKTRSFAVHPPAGSIAIVARAPEGSIGVRGNVADAFGRGSAILLLAGACVLGENRVTADIARGAASAAVQLSARSSVVNANHVVGRRGLPSIRLTTGPFTVLGNVTSGPIELNGAALPPPWDALNA